jgi:site-specific DNA-methyltransferase (adenine-specific)
MRYVPNDYPINVGKEWIGKYKVFVSQVLDSGFDQKKERLKPFLGKPNDICTETFLSIGCFDDEQTALNVISYMNTKFFHLLMFLKKVSHHVVSKVYQYVPIQDFSESWTDEKLYEKYGITAEEIAFIESMIRPMDLKTNEEKEDEDEN